MTRTIRAVLHDPEGETVYKRIPDELKALQDYIGGCVEAHPVVLGGRRCVAYCHEEGRLLGMPPSVCWPDGEVYMVGKVVLTSPDGHGGDDDVMPETYRRMVERGWSDVPWEGRHLSILVMDEGATI